MKRFISIVLAVIMVFGVCVSAGAVDLRPQIDELRGKFQAGEGPVAGDYSVEYMYYSPVKEDDTTKYPLVVWFHGMGDGSKNGSQINKNYVAFWASEEFQSRFGDVDGAFILAPRSREEYMNFWGTSMILPARAAIDDFIKKYGDNIDLSRIYVGGYSMGGRMTYNMAVAYPEMFAAIFPICPAASPSASQFELIKDIPVWLTSGKPDPLVNYGSSVAPGWERLCEISTVASDCRFTTLDKVCYADGEPCESGHHAWYAVNSDMFSYEDGDYPYASTVDGKGNTVELKSPDGMISWLYSYTSDYDGAPATDTGNFEDTEAEFNIISVALAILEKIVKAIVDFFALFGI